MTGHSYITIQKLHDVYGKMVRISPNELSIIDQSASAAIYGQGSKFTKAPYFYRAFENHASNLFTVCNRENHAAEKRLMSNAFSRANILRHESMIHEKVSQVIIRMKKYAASGRPIPLLSAFRCLSLDTITEFCYGEPIGALDDENFRSLQFEAFDIVTRSVPVFQHFPFLRQVLRWVSDYELPFIPAGVRGMEKGAEAGLRIIRNREEMGGKSTTLFEDMLSSAKSRNINLNDAMFVSEGVLMNFAGTDTTALTLTVGLYNLVKQPELFLRLQKSLQEGIQNGEIRQSLQRLENNKLLDACLKESLRLACLVSGRLLRAVPSGSWEFEGRLIPANMIVGSSPYYECYNESIFPEPTEYRPERWLVEDMSEMSKSFHPFSRGPRQCIGQNLSLIEQRIAFAEFVLTFKPMEIIDKAPQLKLFITIVAESDFLINLALV